MYDVVWHIPGKVIKLEYAGKLGLEEVSESNERIKNDFLKGRIGPVHIIANFDGVTGFPNRISDLKKAMDVWAKDDETNVGWIVVIGINSPVLNFLVAMLTQLTKVNMKTETSIENAMQVLRRADLTMTSS